MGQSPFRTGRGPYTLVDPALSGDDVSNVSAHRPSSADHSGASLCPLPAVRHRVCPMADPITLIRDILTDPKRSSPPTRCSPPRAPRSPLFCAQLTRPGTTCRTLALVFGS
jgi:hypothetical protein